MRLLKAKRQARGASLVEMLMYMSCLLVLMSLVSVAIGRLWSAERALHERANELIRVVNAGERWREDVRRSGVSPRAIEANGNEGLLLELDGSRQVYLLEAGELHRTANGEKEVLVRNVVSSRMLREQREGLVYWRWELGVRLGRNATKTQAFTFMAVPGKQATEQ